MNERDVINIGVDGSYSDTVVCKIPKYLFFQVKYALENRDDYLTKPSKGSWSEEEDQILLEQVKKHGAQRWSEIAKNVESRNGKQCRERYLNHLSPELKKAPFSPSEDETIFQYHNKLGNQWAKIAKHLGGRTPNNVKNRWNCTLRRKSRERRKKKKFQQTPSPQSFTSSPIQISQTPPEMLSCSPADINIPVTLEKGKFNLPKIPPMLKMNENFNREDDGEKEDEEKQEVLYQEIFPPQEHPSRYMAPPPAPFFKFGQFHHPRPPPPHPEKIRDVSDDVNVDEKEINLPPFQDYNQHKITVNSEQRLTMQV